VSHILVAEDDADVSALVRHYLVRAGHAVDVVESGSDVFPRLRERLPDLLLLDLMLPGMHGLEVCRLVRANPATAHLPVIIVTARAEESERVAGLEVGADDYVTKPFSPRELVARVAALLRRAQRAPEAGVNGCLAYGPVRLDADHHVVTDGPREVTLTAKEFLLLQYFMRHRGQLLSRDRLLAEVWGYERTVGTRTVDVHIRRLRDKLPVLADTLITVKQFGYKLAETAVAPDEEREF
jgi:DNA-binding response OmpR family regulator